MFQCSKISLKGRHLNESIFKGLHLVLSANVHFIAHLQGPVQRSTTSPAYLAATIQFISDILAPTGKRRKFPRMCSNIHYFNI